LTLLERTTNLKDRCGSLGNLSTRIDLATNLSTRLAELNGAAANLPACLATIRLLRDAGISIENMPDELRRARAVLGKIQSRFLQSRTADSLTRGQDWKQLLRELPATVRALQMLATQTWRAHVERAFAGEAPAIIEARLARTDQNQEALTRYRQAYENFSRAGATLPADMDDVEAVRKAAKNLASIAKDFDFDVPNAVKKFLDALPQGGAPLDLLTDEVRAWIAAQGQTNRFRVIAGGR
jgi:hypothetical protein